MAVIQEIAFINHLPSTSCDEHIFATLLADGCFQTKEHPACKQEHVELEDTGRQTSWFEYSNYNLYFVLMLISKNLITQEFSITKLTQHFFKKMWRAPSIYIGFRPLFFQSQVVGSSWQPQAGDFWISTDFAARSAKSRWELGVWRRILPLCGATLIIFLKRWLWRSMKVQLGKHYWRMSWEKVILMWNNKQKLGI